MSNWKETYKAADLELKSLTEKLEAAKEKRSKIVEALLAGEGRGPFDLDGKSVSILNKSGTYFFKSARGPGKPKEAQVAPEGTSAAPDVVEVQEAQETVSAA